MLPGFGSSFILLQKCRVVSECLRDILLGMHERHILEDFPSEELAIDIWLLVEEVSNVMSS
jgi:hypothetical protein